MILDMKEKLILAMNVISKQQVNLLWDSMSNQYMKMSNTIVNFVSFLEHSRVMLLSGGNMAPVVTYQKESET